MSMPGNTAGQDGWTMVQGWTRTHAWRIFLLASVLRLAAVFVFGETTNPQLWEFGGVARSVASGLGYTVPSVVGVGPAGVSRMVPTAYMPPGYAMFLATFIALFGDRALSYGLTLGVQSLIGGVSAVVMFYFPEEYCR